MKLKDQLQIVLPELEEQNPKGNLQKFTLLRLPRTQQTNGAGYKNGRMSKPSLN